MKKILIILIFTKNVSFVVYKSEQMHTHTHTHPHTHTHTHTHTHIHTHTQRSKVFRCHLVVTQSGIARMPVH